MSQLPANWVPPERRPRRTTIFPALITMGCALLLLGGSAFGFMATCSYSGRSPWNGFFAGLTAVLFVVFVIAIVWFLVAVLVAFFTAGKSSS